MFASPSNSDRRHPRRPFAFPLLRVRRPRLLLVEDDPDLALYLERIARSVAPDLLVDRTPRAVEARVLLDAREYDLVVADYLLEGRESGLALRSACQGRPTGPRFALMSVLPVADLLGPDEARSLPFLPKPFTKDECREFLCGLLAAG